jgi:AAA15 family ATPase/GTPase
MQFKSLHINNYRAITDLELRNFARVNLLTGRNNCGKTTILEALFQISGMSNPELSVRIHNFRDLLVISADDFRFIFHNLDFEKTPKISALLDNTRREIALKPRYSNYLENVISNEKINSLGGKIISDTGSSLSVEGLLVEFRDGKTNTEFKSQISMTGGRADMAIDARYKERLRCTFHNPVNYMAILPQRIEKLLVNKQIEGIITALQEIDPKISDIRLGAGAVIYVDVGLDKLLPLNIMGDGIRRILSLLAAVSEQEGGVLLIDEIENGLHYSALKTLWKTLLKSADVYHVQLFVTTHSSDCIAALDAVSRENASSDDDVRLYRIEKTSGAHKVFEYSPAMIASAVADSIEMR